MTTIKKGFSFFARPQRSEDGRKAKNPIIYLLLFFSFPSISLSQSPEFYSCADRCQAYYSENLYPKLAPLTGEEADYLGSIVQHFNDTCYNACYSNDQLNPEDHAMNIPPLLGYITPANPNLSPPPLDNSPLIAAAAAIAFGLLAAVGAIVSAPALVTSALTAAAIGSLIASAPLTSDSLPDSITPPLSVKLTPSPSSVPAPIENDSRPPGVQVNPFKQFAPEGPSYVSPQSGGWEKTTTPTEVNYSYKPPSTVDNPNPSPTMEIKNNGYSLVYTGTTPNNGKSGVVIDTFTDGSYTVTQSSLVPVTTSSGNQTTATIAKTDLYNSNNVKIDTVTHIGSTLGNGQTANPDTLDFSNGSGGGTGGDTGGDSGGGEGGDSGAGGCTGGDCATETTQLANKSILQQIRDFFTQSGTSPTVPNAKTSNDFKDASLTRDSSVFSGILGFQLPAHNSTCPQPSFDYNGETYSFTAHCDLVTDHFAAFRAVFTVIFTLSALFIVLRA